MRDPTFPHSLSPASFIQFDDDTRILGFEVGRRIVERDMPVFSDTEESHINRRQFPPQFPHRRSQVGCVAFDQVVSHHAGSLDHPLAKHLARAPWMRDGHAYTFVGTKSLHLIPSDVPDRGERFEKAELGGPGGHYDPCRAMIRDCKSHGRRCLFGAACAKRPMS